MPEPPADKPVPDPDGEQPAGYLGGDPGRVHALHEGERAEQLAATLAPHPFETAFGTAALAEAEREMELVQAAELPGRSAPGSARTRATLRRLGWGFWVAVGWCVLWILLALLANVLPLHNPDAINCIANSGPSASHPLGCDNAGRDILSRVIYGSRVSLIVGFSSIGLGLAVGGVLGILAGYLRGVIDSVLSVVANVLLSFPALVLGLAIVSFLGDSLFDIVLIIAIIAVGPLFRVVRGITIALSERDYVLAARALGARPWQLLVSLIVPDVLPTAITYGLVGVSLAIVGEGALSYLGQSVPTPTPTWGNMIAAGSIEMQSNLWLLLSPAIAMFLFILAINIIGDRLRSVLDVREGVL